MARLSTCGFEVQALGGLASSESADFRIVGAPVVETTTVRTGAGAMKVASGAASAKYGRWDQTIANGTTAYLRAYVRFDGTPTGDIRPLTVTNSAGTNICHVRMSSGGTTLTLRDRSNATVGSASAALSANTWYRVELKVKLDASPTTGNGTLELRLARYDPALGYDVDQVTVASSTTADIFISANAPQAQFRVGQSVATDAGVGWFFDDVAVNDSSGSDQNDFPGFERIVLLRPAADTVRDASWLNGASGTTNLFDAVDNTPPVGVASPSVATSQIRSASLNTTDVYTATTGTYAAAGIAAGDRINVVLGICNAGGNVANIVTGLTLTSNPSGSEVTQAVPQAGTYPTGWQTFQTAALYAPSVTLSSGAQIKVRKTFATNELFVDLMGVYVSYTPQFLVTVSDTATVSESQGKAIGAAQTDTATPSEALGKAPAHPLADTATASETHAAATGKAQADTATASEAHTAAAGKGLTDTATVTDAPTVTASGQQALADTATVSDAIAATVGHVLADTATVTDALTPSLGAQAYTLGLADTATVTDSLVTTLTPQATTVEGGWVRTHRRRLHLHTLDDLVLVRDELTYDLEMDPDLRREEELVLALI